MVHVDVAPAPLTAIPAPLAVAVPRQPEPSPAVPAPAPLAAAPPEPHAGPPPPSAAPATDLDAYVPARVRAHIEQTYYARVSEQATLARLVQDPTFLDDPRGHVALFRDHGIVHVRDVAARVLEVLEAINGVCIPRRTGERLEGFMKSYGVLLAYLHDIGMADASPRGRAAHAAFVAQAVFTPALDEVVAAAWAANSGGIAERLRSRVRTTPAAPGATPVDGAGAEEVRYAAAPALGWDRALRQAALARITATGHRLRPGDLHAAFAGVKVVTLQAGETLIAAGTPAAFVYIPLADGLTVQPLGGYRPLAIPAWAPVGHTGVIRGAPRNATVVARQALPLLMVPRAVYLRRWHHPYSPAELRARLKVLSR